MSFRPRKVCATKPAVIVAATKPTTTMLPVRMVRRRCRRRFRAARRHQRRLTPRPSRSSRRRRSGRRRGGSASGPARRCAGRGSRRGTRFPSAAWSSSKRSRSRAAVSESSEAVGSSARTSAGSPTMALATATRCRCPPDIASGRRPSMPERPTAASAALDRTRHSSSGRPRIQSARATFSSAERTGTSWCDWKTKPSFSRRRRARPRSSRVETSSPRSARRPASGRSRRPRRFRSVVLPLPEGPARTASSPAASSRVASFTPTTRSAPSA